MPLTGATVTDVDSADILTVTVSVGLQGTLTSLATQSELNQLTSATGDGTNLITISGSVSAVNAVVAAGVTYAPVANYNGPDQLVLSVADNHGGSDSKQVDITVTAINDAPVATITPAFYSATEQVVLSLKNNGLSVSDVDAGSGQVTVTLSVGEGTLTVTAGTSGALVSGSGSPSVTVSGTVAQINALLNTDGSSAVSYIDNTDTPGASTTLTLSVDDNGNSGGGGSLIASDTATINITAVNDRPAVQNPIPDQTLNEDTPWTFTVPANTFVDPEGSSLTFAAALALLGNNDAPLPSWLHFDSATRTFAGTPPSNANGSVPLEVVASDGNLSTADLFTLNVIAVNDAPVATGIATLAAIDEDTASPPGATVSFLFANNFSDAADQVLGGSSANSFAGIAISNHTVDASKGAWQYSTDGGGSWTPLAGATTTAAITLNAADLLRFVPASNYNGVATALSANLIEDGQSITSGATLDLTGAIGGSTHISSFAVALSEIINVVNDAPSGADKTVTTSEDAAYTFTVGDFGFSDPDSNALQAVKIATLPVAGTLTNNGSAVTAGSFIAVADITGGHLVFTPAANANGAGYASFTFQVQDNGGTANGGIDLDQTPNTITVDVTAVNDAPVVAHEQCGQRICQQQ